MDIAIKTIVILGLMLMVLGISLFCLNDTDDTKDNTFGCAVSIGIATGGLISIVVALFVSLLEAAVK